MCARALLRGDIAKLDPRTFAHVWGSVFNDNEAANIEIAKLRAKLAEYERAPTVATVVDVGGFKALNGDGLRYANLPPIGSELILRPQIEVMK